MGLIRPLKLQVQFTFLHVENITTRKLDHEVNEMEQF